MKEQTVEQKQAGAINYLMSQVIEMISPRAVLKWLLVYCRHRKEHLEANIDPLVVDKGLKHRIRTHTLIVNGLAQLIKSLEEEDPDDAEG